MNQSTSNILLVRPSGFSFNTETAVSNSFQNDMPGSNHALVNKRAMAEFDNFAATLQAKGVNIFVFEDTALPQKPDAVFPNNWVTFHAGGTVIVYPMQAVNRREEKRKDIIDAIQKEFVVSNLIDLSGYEKEDKFLEGTGSIIFDHINKLAYACLSPRTDKGLFVGVCKLLNYTPICFHAYDKNGKEIYHTNVMMCIAEKFSVICLDSITDAGEKKMIVQSLTKTNHEIIDINLEQMNHFAGNMLALKTRHNVDILVLSQSAFNILTAIIKTAKE